jgi:general secretion pathway protein D
MKHSKFFLLASLGSIVALNGCVSVPDHTYSVKASSVAAGQGVDQMENPDVEAENVSTTPKVQELQSLGLNKFTAPAVNDMSTLFPDDELVVFAAEELPLKDFVHTLFNDLLKRSYVVAQEVTTIEDPVSLNIKEPISQRQAFRIAYELLISKGISLAQKEGVFYLAPSTGQSQGAFGIGNNSNDVPNVPGQVTQVVPIRYGNPNMDMTIQQFVPVRVSRDMQLNTMFITGTYPDVVKALDVIKMLDAPSNRGKYVSLLKLTYLGPEEFSKKAALLMESEGVDNIGINSALGKNLIFVPIEHLGALAVFSSNQSYVERVAFWASKIDVPGEGTQKRYFLYHPSYARAKDLGESIAALLGQSQSGNSSRDTSSAMGSSATESSTSSGASSAASAGGAGSGSSSGSLSVQSEQMSLTVDERSNTIIFYTQGAEYQALLPIIRRLDVMPKQVLLEATIAEVSLTDDFAKGVEFAVRNGKFNLSTSGALGVGGINGLNLGYVDGADTVLARLQEKNQLVNVLSNPYLVVRDGVVAQINVGNELPTISSTTSDPILSDKQTTNITYKQTGLEFSVLPTINGQGLVVMQIQQNISNAASGSLVAGATAIFKRTLETEVIAQSGQTVLLGGLISENDDSTDTKVPYLADIPLIGNLFKSKVKKKVKTELVLLITPRVIDAAEHWHYINSQMKQGFKHLQIKD